MDKTSPTNSIIHVHSNSSDQTEMAGADFGRWLATHKPQGGVFVAMSGDLGAGKTTFVRGVASVISPSTHASSPSYAIINHYGGPREMYHCDLYRITSEDDLVSVGFYDLIDSGIVFVEWASVMDAIPVKEYFTVDISKVDENRREIVVRAVCD